MTLWSIFYGVAIYKIRLLVSRFGAADTLDMTPEVSSVLQQYTPTTMPPSHWRAIRAFVLEAVEPYAEGRTVEAARLALNYMAFFADWLFVTSMAPLVMASLTPNTIEAYTAVRATEVNATVAQRERKLLLQLAGAPAGREPRRRTTTTSTPEAPYRDAELVEFYQWAVNQATPLRRMNCTSILALALGCGLTTSEIVGARRRDIVKLDDGGLGVLVTGRRERVVPALARWEHLLQRLADGPLDEHVLAPNAARTRDTLNYAIVASSGMFMPSPQRLRATWLVAQLNAGTPVNVLLEASGLSSVDSLRRAVFHMAATDEHRKVALLRSAMGAS